MNRALYLLCCLLIVLHSCKGTKALSDTKTKRLKTEKIVNNHYNNAFNFTTINAKVKVRYDDGKQSFSPNVTLRLEKDKKIWVSAKLLGITLAKALITPEKVSYYEKINNTYFEGNFQLLSEWLGTDLDFEKVQQLLLGQALFNLKDEKYVSSIENQKYRLTPKKELELFERLFVLYPDNFKMFSQQLKQPLENRNLLISYGSYQNVGNQSFPKEISILASEGIARTSIMIDYRSVDYNANVSFPFKIPSGYEQVTIE
ncbi:DUF4292 domain-containing protein [Aquimarina sp. M1]